jgi:hypothetical protein
MAVTGSYPNVRFTDSLGRVFSGKFEAHQATKSQAISAAFSCGSTELIEMDDVRGLW